MNTSQQKIAISQLNSKLHSFDLAKNIRIPANGWIHAIRSALKMSLRQLAERMNITAQSVQQIEQREAEGAVTLKTMQDIGKALNLTFVYGFAPNEESLEKYIDKQALKLAQDIVQRTSNSMRLEDQENSEQRIEKAIQERATEIKNTMPRYLWDLR